MTEDQDEKESSSKFAAELNLSIVSRMGSGYWTEDPSIEDCCKPRSSGTLDLNYKLLSHISALLEIYDQEGSGFIDPAIGFSYDFPTAKTLTWTGSLMAYIPMTSASHDAKRSTGIYANLKPSWTGKRWTVSLDNSFELDLYSAAVEADNEDDDEEETTTPSTPDESSTPTDASRTTTIFSTALAVEYAWRPKLSGYVQLRETVTTYDPAATIYWTELSFPGIKYHLPTVQWLLETRWSNASKSISAPKTLSIVLGFIADTP